MEEPNYDLILEAKIKYYGETKAAYHFTAEEYARQYCKYMEWHERQIQIFKTKQHFMNKKIYISGKISGIEAEARAMFKFHANMLEMKGLIVVNPMELPHDHDKSWLAFMREDLKALCDCDMVFFMENWKDSPGAIIEHNLAHALKLKVYYEVTPNNIASF